MKKLLLTSTAILLCASDAHADGNNLYGRLDTGYSWSNNADSSAIISAGVGKQFNDHIRADVTLGYRGWYSATESGTIAGVGTISGTSDVQSYDGLVNAYYDIGHFDRITPYIGGGIGVAYNHADSANVSLNNVGVGKIGSDSRANFAWQLGAGASISLLPALSLDVGYRYLDMGKAQTSDTFTLNNGVTASGARETVDLHGSEIQAGLRYSF